tara:strand:+ start:60812 stop:61444 length:633 start_codon:yes stop_codon:yes gene_type:complete
MKLVKLFSFLIISALVASCYPEKERTISDYDIVGTNFSETANFDNYNTFYLFDSLVLVYDSTDEKPEYPKEAANAVLSTMRANLIAYGWTEITVVDSSNIPDVYIEAATWNSTITGVTYYPGYGYPGWGYPGYGYPGWGYPGWGTSYYQYTTGTVTMNMVDIKNYPGNDKKPEVLWAGAINGILTGGTPVSRIEFSVNQAFTQSPYLNKK